jgi:FXSXX-COOH protein
MNVSVQESAVTTNLPDFRGLPIAEVATTVTPDLADIMRRVVPLSTDPERPAVSAFNSSI